MTLHSPLDSNRYSLKHWSLVIDVIRLPISCTISMASLFQAPDVSIAIGTNRCVVFMDMYLVALKVAA